MQMISRTTATTAVVLVLLLGLGAAVHLSLPLVNNTGSDIYYSYVEGQRIAGGENPYTRILGGNMRENQKYPTTFPLFFLIAALMQRLGLVDYQSWLAALRWMLLPLNLGAGALLFYMLYKRCGTVLAVLGALVWFLNRWNLQISRVANNEIIAIFCLLLALWLFERHRLAALLVLSLSLAFKHFDLFVVPLFLILIWQETAERRLRATLGAALIVASLPVLLSIPFLVWPGASFTTNAAGLARSIFFSATRDAASHVNAPALDSLFGLSGFTARLPMFGLFLLVYVAFAQRRVRIYAACFLVMMLLVDFNSVLFLQYFCWMVPFALLAVAESGANMRPNGVPTLDSR
jgi:hypothetical protein